MDCDQGQPQRSNWRGGCFITTEGVCLDAGKNGQIAGSDVVRAGKPHLARLNVQLVGDHPRAGGETKALRTDVLPWAGPSPRGRGNLLKAIAFWPLRRTIPARAGKPRNAAT